MSTPVIKKRLAGVSPRSLARTTGLFYLITILTGIYAQGFVSGTLVVDGDAAGTATNILAHKGLYQLGFAVYLIEMTCQVVMTALFYELLKPAGRTQPKMTSSMASVAGAATSRSRAQCRWFSAHLAKAAGPRRGPARR